MTLLESLDLNSSLQGKHFLFHFIPGDSKRWHKPGHDCHNQGDFIPVENFQIQDKLFTVCSINGCFFTSTTGKNDVGNIKLFQREIDVLCVAYIISSNDFECKNLIYKVEEIKVFYIKFFM